MTDMSRVLDIWDEELSSIVEIEKVMALMNYNQSVSQVGHRRRILLSLTGPAGLQRRRERKQRHQSGAAKQELSKEKSPVEEIAPPPLVVLETKRHSGTESELSLPERHYTSTSSASETGSDKTATPSKSKRTVGESGTLTLGRRKKKAPPPPAQVQARPAHTSPQNKRASAGPVQAEVSKQTKVQTETSKQPKTQVEQSKKCSKHAVSSSSSSSKPSSASSTTSSKPSKTTAETKTGTVKKAPAAFSCSFKVSYSTLTLR